MNDMQAALLKAGVVEHREVKKVVHVQNEREKQQRILDNEERKVSHAENIYEDEKVIDQQIYAMTRKINTVHATKTVMQGIKAKAGRVVLEHKKAKFKKGE